MFGRGGRYILAVVDDLHFAAFFQAVGAFQHHPITSGQAFGDHRVVTVTGADFQLADGDLLVTVHGIDERAVGAELDRRRGRKHHAFEGVGQQVDIDELIREQRLIAVLVASLEFQGAGGDVDLVVQALQHASGLQFGVTTIPGFSGQFGAGAIARQHGVQAVFRQGERHADRLSLGDDHQRRGVVRRHKVADVQLTQAHTPGDRCADFGEFKVELGIVDRRLIGLYRAQVLADQCFGSIEGLLGDTVFAVQAAIALDIDLSILQLCLILQQGAFGLEQGVLVRTRIDLGQQVARLDHLPFFERNLDQFTANTTAHVNGVQRGHGAQRLVIQREIAFDRRRHAHRHRPARPAEPRTHPPDRPVCPATAFCPAPSFGLLPAGQNFQHRPAMTNRTSRPNSQRRGLREAEDCME